MNISRILAIENVHKIKNPDVDNDGKSVLFIVK